MSNGIWLAVMILLGVGFILLLLRDSFKSVVLRRDDRDGKKAAELLRNPAAAQNDQQPAELQLGEEEEAKRPRRFEPDRPVAETPVRQRPEFR